MGGIAHLSLEKTVTGGYTVTVSSKTGAPSSNRSIRLSDEAWKWLGEQADAQRRSVNFIVGELVDAARFPTLVCKPPVNMMTEAAEALRSVIWETAAQGAVVGRVTEAFTPKAGETVEAPLRMPRAAPGSLLKKGKT